MRRLRISILLLIVDLTVYFNIKRFGPIEENAADVQSFFYVLGFVAVISILLIPFMRRIKLWELLVFWVGITFVLRVAVFNQRPLFGDSYTVISFTEVALFALTVILTQQVAKQIDDFEKAVENITLGNKGDRVRNMADARRDIQEELTRSRRYNHPLSLILIEANKDSFKANSSPAIKQVQSQMMEQYVSVSLGRIIAELLRRSDLVINEEEKTRFVILCPETGLKEAQLLTARIRSLLLARLGVELTCGIGSFPNEALTYEELVLQAEKHLAQPLSEEALLSKTDVVEKTI